ncbi:hypothetical protein BH11ACT8_BH11ACT8_24280 [soil metagenome]
MRARALVVLLVLTMGTSCSSDPGQPDGSSTGTPTSSTATTGSTPGEDPAPSTAPPTSSGVRPPIGTPTQAADWSGDDATYLSRLTDALTTAGQDGIGTDAESIALGRDFCTVVSGGGLVVDKVQFWASQFGIDASIDEVASSAGATYCPDLAARYAEVVAEPEPGPVTKAERADLFRFVVTRTTDDPTAVGDASDRQIEGRAADFCARLRAPRASLGELANLDPADPEELLQAAYAIGLGLSYCPGIFVKISTQG